MSHATEPLSAETSAKLIDLARACKGAARVVAMYPATHPAIQDALGRMTAAGTAAVADGPFQITVTPETLQVGGRTLARPDLAVAELATLLHAHSVGELQLTAQLTPAAWHAFLLLLTQPPAEVRGEGGITRAWEAAGGGPIEIRQIDYGEVLRERSAGDESSWEFILSAYLEGEQTELDEKALAALTAMVGDPERLAAFLDEVAERSTQAGWATRKQAQLAKLLQALAAHLARTDPGALATLLGGVVDSLPRLSPEVVAGLLTGARAEDTDGAPTFDLGSELLARIDEGAIAQFVANAIARERTASGRLAEAFQALVPDEQQRGRVLEAAEGAAAHGPFGQDPMFADLWHQAADMLQSYSDEKYISDAYATDLSKARAAAVEMERISEDPPERVAAWMATVSDEQIRRLDQQVLGDLLVVETRPDDWKKVHTLALTRIEQLVLVGDLLPAQELLDTLIRLSRDPASPVAGDARDGVARLAAGDLMTHLVLFVRQAEEAELPRATRFCLSLGKSVANRLVDAILAEDNARTIRRLREVLLSFGTAAKARVTELCGAPNAAVRRTAVELLRMLGGSDALPHLVTLLDDPEPQVQRDALRAIMQLGTDEAFTALQTALTAGPSRTRDLIMHSVGTLRDERAAPLFAFIVRQSSHRGDFEDFYRSALETLGHLGVSSDATLQALRGALDRGEWWAPVRTRRLRTAAAMALRTIATPEAVAVLEGAAYAGKRGVRAAARAALASPAPSRPAAGVDDEGTLGGESPGERSTS
ncbi:MAG: HEAT repeat domain-containing protein [Vicinamibacterales bacterium]